MSLSPRFNGLDRVIAGLWWWKLRRKLAERKMDDKSKLFRRDEEDYQEWKILFHKTRTFVMALTFGLSGAGPRA